MLTILSALLGFAGPFIPELIKFFRQKQDNAHELALLEMQTKIAASEHMYRMEEINATADIAEMQTLRQPQQSFGVQILDAAKDWPKWIIVPAFYVFVLLDFSAGMVRPLVTYAVMGFYLIYKWALLQQAALVAGDWVKAVPMVWTPEDWQIASIILGFWFGSRAVKAAFGGSAQNSKAGQ